MTQPIRFSSPEAKGEGKDQITEAETSDISSSVAAENRDTHSAQTLWLSRLPWLKNTMVNATMPAENKFLLQLQCQDNDKGLNKDSIIIRSHSSQEG